MDLVSEEDRSASVGLFETDRRNASPTLEDRLGVRAPSVRSETIGNLGCRTTPEDGTADSLSLAGDDILSNTSVREVPCSGTNGALSPTGALEVLMSIELDIACETDEVPSHKPT